MTYNNKLHDKAGKRQKIILSELYSQAIIVQDRETGLWCRAGLNCRLAKDLLLKTDKSLREQIEELQPHVERLESDAQSAGVKLIGSARLLLERLKAKEKATYEQISYDELSRPE